MADHLNDEICSENILILVFNKKNAQWRDASEDISQLKDAFYYGKHSGYYIRFRNNSKRYFYRLDSVQIYTKPITIDTSDKAVIVNGKLLLLYSKIIKFGSFYKIFFLDRNSILVDKFEIRIEKNNFSSKVFRYYQDLIQYAAEKSGNPESIESILLHQFEKIDTIRNNTALYAYLLGESNSYPLKQNLFFPFKFNLSQKNAITNALTNQISIIEGPPGCGKTQTILNLIMNLIISDKTVAVVSNNNSAIENILDILQREGYDFISALLGNRENKVEFFNNSINLSNEKLDTFLLKHQEQPYRLNSDYPFGKQILLLDSLHEMENQKAKKTIELGKVKKEQEHFLAIFEDEIIKNELKINLKHLTIKDCIHLKLRLEITPRLSLFQKLWFRLRYGIDFKWYQGNLVIFLEERYYYLKISLLEFEISSLTKRLSDNDFNRIKQEYERNSRAFLDKFLFSRYQGQERLKFHLDDYKLDFRNFVKHFPVILSTSYSILWSIERDYIFDYLIVDEASQSDLLSSILAMSCAENMVIVGDSKQLEQIDNQTIYKKSEALAREYNVDKKYIYQDNSLLNSAKAVFQNCEICLLKEHYRCHPKTINFLNEKYYNNQLIIMTKDEDDIPINIVHLSPGNHARKNPHGTGQYNLREIDEVEELLKNSNVNDVGIISPFRAQVEAYQKRFGENPQIEIDTVHKFQGRQKNTIILSTVVNNINKNKINERFIDFINNPRLFNVAVSRARKFLTLITTHGLYESKNNNFSDFIKYAEYNLGKSAILKGRVTSVFDMLYSDYTEELYNYLKLHQNKKGIITEIVIYDLLQKILLNYPDLKIAMHVSLVNIFKNFTEFLEEEKKYLNNKLTHVDFLIYNRITKEQLAAIEVDGVKFHEQNQKQSTHDMIKDKAFKLNKLPLLRLKTNESQEEYRIVNFLNQILTM